MGTNWPILSKTGRCISIISTRRRDRSASRPAAGELPARSLRGVKITSNLVDQAQLEADRQQAIDNNPLPGCCPDVAGGPIAGRSTLRAPVQLLPSNDPERPSHAGGRGTGCGAAFVGPRSGARPSGQTTIRYTSPRGFPACRYRRGDRIYFRVGSIDNGSYDSVNWAPVIDYIGQDASLADANGKTLYHFDAAKDFVLSSARRP